MFVELYAKTNVGRVRAGNEDNFLVLDLTGQGAWTGSDGEAIPDGLSRFEVGPKGAVLVVSDGLGGAPPRGAAASRMAVEAVREMLLTEEEFDGDDDADAPLVESLRNATDYANFAIHRRSQE